MARCRGLIPTPGTFASLDWLSHPSTLNWKEFNALPKIQRTSDFHCVTRWSRFDNRWDGVAFRELLARVRPKPEAAYVLVHAEQGFTANVPASRSRPGRSPARHPPRRRAPDRGPRLSPAPHRSSSVCLEVGEVAAWPGISRPRHPRILGTKRLPHVRRPVERAEIQQVVDGTSESSDSLRR